VAAASHSLASVIWTVSAAFPPLVYRHACDRAVLTLGQIGIAQTVAESEEGDEDDE